MRLFRGFDELPNFVNAVVTMGSFDGLHRGHLSLLERLIHSAEESQGESVVLIFERHPRVVLGSGEGLRLLTSLGEKIELFDQLGIDNLVVIPFDRDFSRLPYDQFVREYLVRRIGMERLVVGYNHHFGRDSEGGYSALRVLAEDLGFEIVKVDEWSDPLMRNVSSTSLRSLLSRGDLDLANRLLMRPYRIMGQCDSEGRVWVDDSLKLIPAAGDYRARIGELYCDVEIDDNGVVVCPIENEQVVVELLEKHK